MQNQAELKKVVDGLTQAAIALDAIAEPIEDDESMKDEVAKLTQQKSQITSMIGEYTVKSAKLQQQSAEKQ